MHSNGNKNGSRIRKLGKLEMNLTELGHKHILIWKRFIDDIFIIWTGEFTTYIGTVNT